MSNRNLDESFEKYGKIDMLVRKERYSTSRTRKGHADFNFSGAIKDGVDQGIKKIPDSH